MAATHVSRWVESVKLRSEDEDAASSRSSRRGGWENARVIKTVAGRCTVSVSKRSASSPGAATGRYHEGRPGVEVVRDDGIDATSGPRYSIMASPERSNVDLEVFGSYVLKEIEDAHDTTLNGVMISVHRDTEKPHVHLAVAETRGVYLSQKRVERAVRDAMRAMERSRGRERGMSR